MEENNHYQQKNKEDNKTQDFGDDEKEIELYDCIFDSENQNDQCIDNSKKSKSTKPNNTDYATSERNESLENVAPKNIFLVSKTDNSTSEKNESKRNIAQKNIFLVKKIENSEKMENKPKSKKIFDVKIILPVEQNSKNDLIEKIKDKSPEDPKKENESDTCQKKENSLPNYDTNHPSMYIDLSSSGNDNEENSRNIFEISPSMHDTLSNTGQIS